ncbi:exosortase system-associated protein, TIGR04073 family [Nitrosomonas sp. Nm166]|uniref:exosortase system-associated protein, TIGR04073 family n=1 Tax=Nitrosomonas sp. Nm166 TaxID=1881054 RepID=UPI0008ECAA45|nr:exosortase system-associated protein, TIGR04073 family [Nitrosomonas sp. Nm166]SFE82636.1 putative exosortase-associated protein, TIGR04073 family [Nitrosomonas sp. Nm166]
MQRIVKFSLILSMLFLFSSQAIAADSYFSNSAEKFVSGVTNAVTGWVELPKNIILTSQNEGPLYGVSIGTAMGIMHTVGRTLIGVLDAATFFIPTKPSVNPPFIWQDFSRETSY